MTNGAKLRWAFLLFFIPLIAVAIPGTTALAKGRAAKGKIAQSRVKPDCTLQGHKLFGKVKVVTAFPDLKVQVVDAFPDLNVTPVDAFPDKCGQWKMVDSFPELKIQFVDAFPDLKIKYVKAFPGRP